MKKMSSNRGWKTLSLARITSATGLELVGAEPVDTVPRPTDQ